MSLDILDLAQIEWKFKGKLEDMEFMRNPLLTNYIYPNCVAFDDAGWMFIGDSIGFIWCWDVSIF